MKAVILAGGEGTRLRPLTLTRPKPFVPVGPRPCIEYVLESLRRAGVRDVLVTTHYRPDALIRHLGGGAALGLDVAYSVEDAPLGTAGAVRKVSGFLDGTFVVASGDVFADVDVASLVEFHEARGALATMALAEVENPSQFGIVGLDDDGRVTRFKEKPKTPEETFSNLVNAGIYVLEPEVLERVPAGEPFDFSKDLFPRLLAVGAPFLARRLEGAWIDIGRPEDLLAANALVAERAGGVVVAEGADVARDASVATSALHARSRVLSGAKVTRSLLLEDAEVAEGAVVTDSILGAGAAVGPNAVVRGAVLGDGSRVGARAEVSGLRLDPGELVQPGLRAGSPPR